MSGSNNSKTAFQDQHSVEHCYGCGADNSNGLQLKSYWDGAAAIASFTPKKFHCGGSPEIVYGGVLASLIDCHSCNLAIATYYKLEQRPIGSYPRIRCVSAQLNVAFKTATPIGSELKIRAKVRSQEGRKTWVDAEIWAVDVLRVTGEVLLVRIDDIQRPESSPA